MKQLQQKIISDADPNAIFREIVKWSESEWWPDIPMEFVKLSGSHPDNAVYAQKARVPFGPKWHTRVKCVDRGRRYIRKDFLDGMFKGGYEEISLAENNKRIDIVYNFCYQIRNPLNNFLWDLVFKRMHTRYINLILESLKEYLEVKNQ